jgi:Protein of unknown function (DUF3309)
MEPGARRRVVSPLFTRARHSHADDHFDHRPHSGIGRRVATWGYSRDWGYGPGGGLGLILLIIVVLALTGHI